MLKNLFAVAMLLAAGAAVATETKEGPKSDNTQDEQVVDQKAEKEEQKKN